LIEPVFAPLDHEPPLDRAPWLHRSLRKAATLRQIKQPGQTDRQRGRRAGGGTA